MDIQMRIYRTYVGDNACSFVVPENNNNKLIVVCSGLPGQPENYDLYSFLVNLGYIVVHPKYRGTWESYGKFLDTNPATEIKEIVEYLNKERKLVNKYDNSYIDLLFDEIILLGSSFGGSIVIVAGAMTNVSRIIALSPVINYKSKLSQKSTRKLFEFINKAYGRAYDFDKNVVEKLNSGEIKISPIGFVNNLKDKQILIICGEKDPEIPVEEIVEFAKHLDNNVAIEISKNVTHFSLRDIANTEISTKFNNWIGKR